MIAKFGLIATMSCVLAGSGPTRAIAVALPSTSPTHGKQLIWSDEFAGSAGGLPDPTKWSFDIGGGGWGNRELQYYTPSSGGNAVLDGRGHLKIIARKGRLHRLRRGLQQVHLGAAANPAHLSSSPTA